MKKKGSTKKGRAAQAVHAYQTNPYALARNATPARSQELVPIVVAPAPAPRRRRGRSTRAVQYVKQQASERLGDNQFLTELGLAAVGAGAGAFATGWAEGKEWNPWATGITTLVLGGVGALTLPGAWRGAGIGVSAWGLGKLVQTGFHEHNVKVAERKQKADEEKKMIEQARADQQRALDQSAAQKSLPPPKPSNAFNPAIRDAFASVHGRYGRADDEERMTDLDLVLG